MGGEEDRRVWSPDSGNHEKTVRKTGKMEGCVVVAVLCYIKKDKAFSALSFFL